MKFIEFFLPNQIDEFHHILTLIFLRKFQPAQGKKLVRNGKLLLFLAGTNWKLLRSSIKPPTVTRVD